MTRLLETFYRGLCAMAAVAMVGALASVLLGIIDRQWSLGLRGLDAYAGYCIAAALFLALPETLRRGEHIRVTLLLQRAPKPVRAALDTWSQIAGLALSVYLAWFAVRLVWVSWSTHDISQGSDATPLWIPQVGMALGCVGLAVAFADAMVAKWQARQFFPSGSVAAANVE